MGSFKPATIIERIDITSELATFRIASPEPISFSPGQFVRLGLEVDGRILQRSYSIVSAPHEEYLEFFFELVPKGRLTPSIWKLNEGDSLLIHTDAAGVFTLDRTPDRTRHLMVATVTGIAPYLSMLRAHARALENGQVADLRFLLIHNTGNVAELGHYGEELSAIADAEWLIYIPTISRPAENPEWRGEVGRAEDLIRKYSDTLGYDYLNATAYACGHPEMIANAKGVLERARFPRERIRTEKYFAMKKGE